MNYVIPQSSLENHYIDYDLDGVFSKEDLVAYVIGTAGATVLDLK